MWVCALVYMCVYGHMHVIACVWHTQDNLQESEVEKPDLLATAGGNVMGCW